MAALMIAVELADADQRILRLEEQLNAPRYARFAAAERAKATQAALASAPNSASERL